MEREVGIRLQIVDVDESSTVEKHPAVLQSAVELRLRRLGR